MNCGIIDIGSNTMRLAVYRCEDGKVLPLINKKEMVGLAGYIVDNKLSKEGIERACTTLNNFKDIIDSVNIDMLQPIATASLRNIANTDEALYIIKEKTGFDIEVLSGAEEGICDFVGATHDQDINDGLLVDIGGGSTEIVIFHGKDIEKVFSMPIGSLNFYSKYVSKLIPKSKSRDELKAKVISELNKIEGIQGKSFKNMCGVGGSIRAALKLNNAVFTKLDSTEIDVNNINKLLYRFRRGTKDNLEVILKICPDRIHTIIPGMIIIDTICKYFDIETIHVSNCGVREGYLYRHILDK